MRSVVDLDGVTGAQGGHGRGRRDRVGLAPRRSDASVAVPPACPFRQVVAEDDDGSVVEKNERAVR
jgi:hypothetical protein